MKNSFSPNNIKILLFAALVLALVLPFSAARAAAPPPPAHRTHSVSALVGQLAKDAATMADAAREARNNPRVGIEAITHLDDLYHSADSLYRLLMNGNPSVQTINEYLALRQAYFDARPYFDGLPDSDAVRAAIWRTRDNILSVASIYLGDYKEAEAEARRVPPDPPVTGRLRNMAADIARRASFMAHMAKDKVRRANISQEEREPFDKLNQAAQRFYEYIAIHGSENGVAVRDRYEELVRGLQGVRDVISDFHVDVQMDLRTLWNETNQLSELAPDLHLGKITWRDLYDLGTWPEDQTWKKHQ